MAESNTPLVSVAMATYNGAKYLGEQLGSIINQTHQNIEIVIVDDCSKDSTVEVIKSFQLKYPFITLLQNGQNSGVTRTFETAIKNCNGAYIALSDQDDIWVNNKLEILVNEIGGYDAVYANSLLVDAEGNSLGKSFAGIMNMKTYHSGASFLLSNSVPGHAILMKKSFVQQILPFPEKMLFDLWIGFNAAGNNGIKFVDRELVHYRQHDTNTIGTRDSKNKKKKKTAAEEFAFKLNELKTLATAPIKDERTKKILNQMIALFNKKWSFKRSAFFFKYYNDILISKKKPTFRKKLFCLKMFFKPNY